MQEIKRRNCTVQVGRSFPLDRRLGCREKSSTHSPSAALLRMSVGFARACLHAESFTSLLMSALIPQWRLRLLRTPPLLSFLQSSILAPFDSLHHDPGSLPSFFIQSKSCSFPDPDQHAAIYRLPSLQRQWRSKYSLLGELTKIPA